MNMKKSLTSLALVGLLGLTACSTDAVKSDNEAPRAETVATQAPASEASPSQTVSIPEDLQDELAAFGDEWTYGDGITVKVVYGGVGQVGEYAVGAEATAGQVRLFDVSIINNSEKIFDPEMFYADVNYGPEGLVSSRVFDTANGFGDNFQGKILPGGTQTVNMAYAMPADAPTDILMTVTPSWDHSEKLFHGVAVL